MTMNATIKHKACRISAVRSAALAAGAALIFSAASAQTSDAPTEPTGFARIDIAAGTGTTKRTSLVSIPLLEDVTITGRASGRITDVGANTITVSGAGWTAGALSSPAAPYLLEITSGMAQGRMLLISTVTANTTDTVTIEANEAARSGDLQNLGIVTGAENGDTFQLRPVDTLSSFFGTPDGTGILGGASPATADTVTLVVNGSATTYFYHTGVNPPRWSRVGLGSQDASNVPIPPYAGLQYGRLGSTPLALMTMGRMPSGARQVAVKNSGITLLSSYWPVQQTLAEMGVHNLPNWKSGVSAEEADTVVLSSAGSATTYFHDGSNWRRVGLGGPVSDAVVVSAGTSVMINKKGSETGFATYQHTAPYSLQ